jgi:hypothetical protein
MERNFDLVVLSHVLEHVLTPAALLARCLGLASLVVNELSARDNHAGRIRRRLLRRPPWPDPSGHVQLFSRPERHEFVAYAGRP